MKKSLSKELKAIHTLLIEGRKLSYDNEKRDVLPEYFDDIEYLVALLLEDKFQDELFDKYLKGMCKKFNYPMIHAKFSKKN